MKGAFILSTFVCYPSGYGYTDYISHRSSNSCYLNYPRATISRCCHACDAAYRKRIKGKFSRSIEHGECCCDRQTGYHCPVQRASYRLHFIVKISRDASFSIKTILTILSHYIPCAILVYVAFLVSGITVPVSVLRICRSRREFSYKNKACTVFAISAIRTVLPVFTRFTLEILLCLLVQIIPCKDHSFHGAYIFVFRRVPMPRNGTSGYISGFIRSKLR